MQYLKKLEKNHKDFVTLETIGISVEGRDIVAVKISSRSLTSKPAVVITAGLSPREWIGPAQALYIIQELVENPNNKEMIGNLDWYIVPIVNPDGYVYTHTKVSFQFVAFGEYNARFEKTGSNYNKQYLSLNNFHFKGNFFYTKRIIQFLYCRIDYGGRTVLKTMTIMEFI